MTKLSLLLICIILNSCAESQIYFRNADLRKEVNSFLKDLKKTEIHSIIFETNRIGDSVIFSMTSGYPNIKVINAYSKYKGVYFCFKEEAPAREYYEIVNPESVPSCIKEAYEERRKNFIAINYEPFSKHLVFYKGRLFESVVINED